jgi:hypothetical protein
MAEPASRLLIRDAIMDAIDGMIRDRAAGPERLEPGELEAWVAERNRVAEALGRPAFGAADLLVRGTDD